MLQPVLMIIFPLVVAYAAVTDFFTMTIANKISIALVAGFCGLAPFVGFTWTMASLSLAGAAIVFAIGFACFSFGWVGGALARLVAPSRLSRLVLALRRPFDHRGTRARSPVAAAADPTDRLSRAVRRA